MWHCSKCFLRLEDDEEACRDCGTPKQPNVLNFAYEPPIVEPNQWDNPWTYIAMMAVGLLFALFLCWGGESKGSFMAAVALVGGPYTLVIAWTNSPWLWHTAIARNLVSEFGQTLARVVYTLLGLSLIVFGVLLVKLGVPQCPW